jgi:hypothetical protein
MMAYTTPDLTGGAHAPVDITDEQIGSTPRSALGCEVTLRQTVWRSSHFRLVPEEHDARVPGKLLIPNRPGVDTNRASTDINQSAPSRRGGVSAGHRRRFAERDQNLPGFIPGVPAITALTACGRRRVPLTGAEAAVRF